MGYNLYITGIILGMGSANESRRYNVTSSLIGWSQNNPCIDAFYLSNNHLYSRRKTMELHHVDFYSNKLDTFW